MGRHSVRLMRPAVGFVRSTGSRDHEAAKAFTLALAREVAPADLGFIGRIKTVRREMERRVKACGGASAGRWRRESAPPWPAETARLGESIELEKSTDLLPLPAQA